MQKYKITVFFIISLISSGIAAAPVAMRPVDMLNIPSLSNGQLDEKGETLYFVKAATDWKKNKMIPQLWRYQIKSGALMQLTFSEKGTGRYRLSPDGKKIALSRKDKKGKIQIFVMNTSGGESTQLTMFKGNIHDYRWSADSTRLVILKSREPTKTEQKQNKNKDDVFSFDEEVFSRQLWLQEVESKELSKLVAGKFSVRNFSVSDDGKKILYSRSKTSSRDNSLHSDLWLFDFASKKSKRITKNIETPEKRAELSPNNKSLLYLSWVDEKGETYQEDNLFLQSINKSKSKQLLGSFDHEIRGAAFSKNGQDIYFVANMGVHSELFSWSKKNGKISQLTSGKHQIKEWRYFRKSDKHLLRLQSAQSKGDYWLLDGRSKGRELKQVTHIFDDLSERFKLPEQRAVRWKSEDGEIVEGLVTFPLDFQQGKKYPLVVQTHGGPRSASMYDMFHSGHYLPVLSAMGYMTLQPNYRGSTGYGDKFVRDMVNGYFKNAHKDVLSGVDYLIAKGWVDGDKMVKMGWSAGGHLTNKVVTFTDRFKAASSGAGASNWISMYSQSDTRVYRTPWFGGNPWQPNAPIDTYWEHSPLKDVSKVKTPTLILVGENDVRVPKEQSIEFFRGLRANGVETKLYIAPREPHGWRESRHRLFKINVELDWFERYLFNRDYIWQEAPTDLKQEPNNGD